MGSILGLLITLLAASPPQQCPASGWVLPTFQGTLEQLIIAYSADGINYPSECAVVMPVPGETRDPSLYKDGSGMWWLVTTRIGGFQLLSSSDLKVWSAATTVSIPVTGAVQWWAPEWVVDVDASVHVVLAVAIADTYHFQIYEIHPTASDMSAWSAAQPIVVAGVTNLIDPFVNLHSGVYSIWYKNGSSLGDIAYATSTTLLGPYTSPTVLSFGGAEEGPSVFWTGGNTWRLYFDKCGAVDSCLYTTGELYYTTSTDNWATWSTPVPLPTGFQAKQGTPHVYP